MRTRFEQIFRRRSPFNFHSKLNGQLFPAVIIWGTHRDDRSTNEERLWCRVFDMHAIMEDMDSPIRALMFLHLDVKADSLSPGEVQHSMEAFREQLCRPRFGQFLTYQRVSSKKYVRKKLFPKSCNERYDKDELPNVINHPDCMLGLTVNISCTQGLGRTLYELKISIKAMGEQTWR